MKTFVINKGQRPTEKQQQEVMEVKNIRLNLTKIVRNRLLQCIKPLEVL